VTAQAEGPASKPVPLVCSVDEAAELLGVGRTLVFRLIATGKIESLKIGSRRLIPRAAIDGYIERLSADQSAEPDQRPHPGPSHRRDRQPDWSRRSRS
jgi:excisionase family DNA binding protein